LVAVQLDEDVREQFPLALMEVSDYFEQILWYVLHKQVQVQVLFGITFAILVLLPLLFEVGMHESNHTRVLQLLQNVKLPVLIVLILQHFLYSDLLSIGLQSAIVHDAKSSLSDDLMFIILPVFIFAPAESVLLLVAVANRTL
jgi:hypothetical protein